MSDTPLADALKKVEIPDVPPETVTLAVDASKDDVGVSLQANKDLGKPGGWAGGGEAGYWKSVGWRVRGWLTWKGK